MSWLIWISICIYLCIGAWVAGYIISEEEVETILKAISISLLMIFLWSIAFLLFLIRLVIDYLPRLKHKWFNLRDYIKRKYNRVIAFIKREKIDEFDEDDTTEDESIQRHLRMGLSSRLVDEQWDSKSDIWET